MGYGERVAGGRADAQRSQGEHLEGATESLMAESFRSGPINGSAANYFVGIFFIFFVVQPAVHCWAEGMGNRLRAICF
jgi:hypothetical protein